MSSLVTPTSMVATSATWEGERPSIAALVATFRRPEFLPGLLAAFESQDLPRTDFELIVVDNGSGDGTWDLLEDLTRRSPMRVCAVRVPTNHGPGRGRNAGSDEASAAPLMAITDDDCLPTPGWLRAMREALSEPGVEVVQGAVHADPAGRDAMGPWDHTKWITVPTPFFETCNVGYRVAAFERVDGFDETDPLLHPPDGRAFGEDACLAWAVQASGGEARFINDALVHHRCIPGSYRRWLTEQAHVVGFPGLARRSELVRRWLWQGAFLDQRTAAFDLAVVGLAVAGVKRSPWPAIVALPWLRLRWKRARQLSTGGRAAALPLLGRLAVGDAVTVAKLVQGSVRYRRVVL